jgi:hypothetical protein
VLLFPIFPVAIDEQYLRCENQSLVGDGAAVEAREGNGEGISDLE